MGCCRCPWCPFRWLVMLLALTISASGLRVPVVVRRPALASFPLRAAPPSLSEVTPAPNVAHAYTAAGLATAGVWTACPSVGPSAWWKCHVAASVLACERVKVSVRGALACQR